VIFLHVDVAAGFSLRFPSSGKFATISYKLRNLKVAATKITQFRLKLKPLLAAQL
jgi:hypothetical protein